VAPQPIAPPVVLVWFQRHSGPEHLARVSMETTWKDSFVGSLAESLPSWANHPEHRNGQLGHGVVDRDAVLAIPGAELVEVIMSMEPGHDVLVGLRNVARSFTSLVGWWSW